MRLPALAPVPETPQLSARLAALVDDAKSQQTRTAYAADWRRWEAWCAREGIGALPARPVDVAEYLARYGADIEEGRDRPHAASTLMRWVAGIDAMHRTHGFPQPGRDELVRRALAGARRRQARARQTAMPGQAEALTLTDLRLMLAAIATTRWPGGVIATRDAALLLTGFAGGRRRSELVTAKIMDLRWHAHDGFHWVLPFSKTDQDGHGHTVVLPRGRHTLTCVACALTRWLQLRAVLAAAAHAPPGHDESGLAASTRSRLVGRRQRTAAMWVLRQQKTQQKKGKEAHVCQTPPGWRRPGAPPLVVPLASLPLGFRAKEALFVAVHRTGRVGAGLSGEAVTDALLRARRKAGLPTHGYSAHSLRAGFVSEADRAQATVLEIQQQTGHRTHESVAVYRRRHSPADGNAVSKLGL
ncbi:tyrosine-type recombinase/integrase [Leekyejoonella antrihumi]|uniref:Integrase n=1 Tax=Leekyejoonella antrihumi TaxID=1660198 RepID=A0A563DSN4_9MICO|nr:tyrosine-type recombinase/integrase [Leekyejoonella antrihumi]TWP33186.1 hypothetical protein FGL98_22210 [Leekyejoonella antrihumi]